MGATREVAPAYQKKCGVKLNVLAAPSMGDTPQAIPNRLAKGEDADVVLMVGSALDTLIADGQADKASRVDLGKSFIAMAVRQGEPKPDISTMQNLRKVLVESKSVAYSDSASGVYLSKTLFPRMQLGSTFDAKAHMIPAEPVGAVVARGQAQIGFQQLSELKPVPGISIVGLIPAEAQKMTMYPAPWSARASIRRRPRHCLNTWLRLRQMLRSRAVACHRCRTTPADCREIERKVCAAAQTLLSRQPAHPAAPPGTFAVFRLPALSHPGTPATT